MAWSAVSAFVGLVLVLAGTPKLLAPRAFSRVVRGFRILPEPLARPTARVVPVAEVLAGGALVVGVATPAAAAVAVVLFAAFTTGLVVNLARGRRDIDCGCFGFTGAPAGEVARIGPWHALRAAALGAASAVLVLADPAAPAVTERLQGACLAAVVLLLALVVARVTRVVDRGPTRADTHLAGASVRYRAALAHTSR
ncbi:MauE/DoxX family redox-associated membrane protein [Kineococcus auxinigenes]|uniref:MauE/DoxX family redox-associated membrane protein n=1 Tax=unclassified Kineococcus TaxID=2621656 RepID=UPI003D7D38B6